ncbi:MAG: Extracellular ligand-binding receptor [Thermoleophilia bacterium]|nr:Extracellular ligand-binding receptor [Thermoleophilia bacterium]
MRRLLSAGATITLALLIAAGCGGDDDSNGNGNGGGGGNDFTGEMTIGAIVPLTGGLAAFGAAGQTAAELAVREINTAQKADGLDGEVTLATQDGQTEEAAGRSAAEKLIRTDNASCIAGDWPSGSTIAIAKSVTVDEGVPLISPSSTDAAITELEDDGLVFRTAPSDLVQSEVLAKEVAKDLDGEGTVAVAAVNNAYGSAFAEAFADVAEANGLDVLQSVLYDPKGTEFDTEADQIVEGDPDAYVVVDYPDQGWPKMGPALQRTGVWSADKTWGADGLRSTDLTKQLGAEITVGMRGTAPTSVESGAADAFTKLWDDNGEGARQTYDAQNFDATMLCYLGALAAGSTDGADIAEQLQDVSSAPGLKVTLENLQEGIEALQNGDDIDYDGASGPIDLDENGDPTAAEYEIWQYTPTTIDTLTTVPVGGDAEEADGDATGEDSADTADTADTDDAGNE